MNRFFVTKKPTKIGIKTNTENTKANELLITSLGILSLFVAESASKRAKNRNPKIYRITEIKFRMNLKVVKLKSKF